MKTMGLSLMMFVQYLMLPVWLLPLLPYLGTLEGGSDWVFAFVSNLVFHPLLTASATSGHHDWCAPFLTAFAISVALAFAAMVLFHPSEGKGSGS